MSISSDEAHTLLILVVGLFTIYLLVRELRTRGKVGQAELEFQHSRFEREQEQLKKRFESEQEQAQRRLELDQKRFDHERNMWVEQDANLKRQVARFEALIGPIATRLKEELVIDTTWLTESLRRSELFPYQDTVFGERSSHFVQEKNSIARMFSHFFILHIEELLKTKQRVCLFIDSGTTLYPFFEVLGQIALEQRARDPRPRWIEHLEIITNNLPGVLRMMSLDRPERADGTASLPITCTVVSGQILTEYVAITGPDTQAAIERLIADRRQRYDDCHFIALVTGNWVRIRRQSPVAPLPLARGIGHLDFKQLIMHHSQENYVVAPLAKIFIGPPLDAINELLGTASDASSLKKSSYREIITNDKIRPIRLETIRLVTTIRTERDSILRPHSAVLASRYGVAANPNVHRVRLGDPTDKRPVLLPFDLEQTDVDEQKLIEFPHPTTRRPAFYRHFEVEFREK